MVLLLLGFLCLDWIPADAVVTPVAVGVDEGDSDGDGE